MTDWTYKFFPDKPEGEPLTEDEIEDFEAHAAMMQDKNMRREREEAHRD